MKDKLISVIVPVYNVEKYVEQCVRSIMSQTYEKLEIILVDDGAKDNSGAICDRLAEEDKRIRVIHKENGGVSSARNVGIDVAQGEWIAFVDGDDYIDPTMYEKLAARMTDDVDITFCCYQSVYKNNEVRAFLEERVILSELAKKPYDIRALLCWSRPIIGYNNGVSPLIATSVWRSLFKKEIINREKIYFRKQIKMGEDRLFLMEYLNLSKKGDVVEETLYYYRKDLESSATANSIIACLDAEHEKWRYLHKKEIVLKNEYYSKEEKDFLILHLGYEYYYTFTTTQIRNKDNYKKELKKYHQDEEVVKILKTITIKNLRSTGYSFKEIIQIMLIKWRLWRIYKMLSK